MIYINSSRLSLENFYPSIFIFINVYYVFFLYYLNGDSDDTITHEDTLVIIPQPRVIRSQ